MAALGAPKVILESIVSTIIIKQIIWGLAAVSFFYIARQSATLSKRKLVFMIATH
mgnify:CR=1 FL=1|jgi:hypothetical protein